MFLLLAVSLFHLDLYIANRNFQIVKLNSEIHGISLTILFSSGSCLMNAAILRREHIMFLTSLAKYLSTLNKK